VALASSRRSQKRLFQCVATTGSGWWITSPQNKPAPPGVRSFSSTWPGVWPGAASTSSVSSIA